MSNLGHSQTPSILFLGSDDPSTTSRQRADSLVRIGCKVLILNPSNLIGFRTKWQRFLDYRTGFFFIQRKLLSNLLFSIANADFTAEVIWIDSGELVGPRIVKFLSRHYRSPVILYNVDDPTGSRDGRRFISLARSLPFYTLTVFTRLESSLEAMALGAQRSVTVSRSYDEVVHVVPADRCATPLSNVVSFIGTFIPGEKRDHFLLQLANSGLPLIIRGNRWNRSISWPKLRHFCKAAAVYGEEYSLTLKNTAINIGLLSHRNRDLVTQRTFEIPACGGLFCAERTSEHQLLFEDGVEAAFWDSDDECIAVCKKLLADVPCNQSIRTAGHNHMLAAGFGNEDICRQILSLVA
jgi:spore maturation protein CgeB